MTSSRVLIATTDAHRQAAFTIRIKVFCDEQGYSLESELDALDATSTHLIGLIPHIPSTLPTLEVDGSQWTVAGAARVFMEDGVGRLGRLAVVLEARGTGLGGKLVGRCEEALKVLGAGKVVLHAQVPKRGFYEKYGYVAVGDEYDEDGAPHITMEKSLV
ncbi:GCN5-like N-acetyltransferase [Chytridium lagenaria]|nr:GCN5-like N-acetyltransferase [Chytridium lagenaria]